MQGFIQMCIEYIRVERYAAELRNAMPNFYRDWHQLIEMLKKQDTSDLNISCWVGCVDGEVCMERGI